MEPNAIKLIVVDGNLYLDHDVNAVNQDDDNIDGIDNILIYQYPSGDYDFIPYPAETSGWTMGQWVERLIRTLFNGRETGAFPSHVNVAILPDGTRIEF